VLPESLIALWVAGLLAALGLLALADEFRRRRIGSDVSQDQLFRCVRCTSVYTDDAEVERSRCPHCGKTNEAVRF
jgi:rRNA maturation endonuclease Nob1